MLHQGWLLLLCSCMLGCLCGASPTGRVAIWTSPQPRHTGTGPANGAQLSEGPRAGSAWPIWTVDKDKTTSFLSLPFSLPFDLWSSDVHPQEKVRGGNAESLGKTLVHSSNQSGSAGYVGMKPDPATGLKRKESFVPTRTEFVAQLTNSDPPTSAAIATGEPDGNRRPVPWVIGTNDKDTLSPTPTQPAETLAIVTATSSAHTPPPASGAEGNESGEPTHSDHGSTAPPAPITMMAAEPESAINQATEETMRTDRKIDGGSPESRQKAAEERMEEGVITGGGRGDFEDVAWPVQTAPPISTGQPAGTSPELARQDDISPEVEAPIRFWTASISSVTPLGPLLSGTSPELARQDDISPEVEAPIRFWTASISSVTPLGPLLSDLLADEDWSPDVLPDDSPPPNCNAEAPGLCNASGSWGPAFPKDDNATSNRSQDPFLLPAPPMFVPLYSDWNSAMVTWGVAWEAHVYGLGAVFALVALASALNLLCLPVRCPSGCGYFALVDLFLLTACCSRAFSLFYDAYSHQDKLTASGTLLLYEVPFPCLTAAFGIVFLLLSMRSRMQLSNSIFQHPCFLAALVLLHFGATLGSVVLLQVFTRLPGLFFVSQGSFVALAAFLSAAYFAFYCYVRADAKHIYHLNNTSPPADRYHRCPFADPKDWDRAAVTAVFSAIFTLACAGLQLYAMLHALGLGGVEVFRPWPWWAFHLSCRVCEAGVCLTLALVVAPPLCCSSSSGGDLPRPGLCWPHLFCARGQVDLKSPVLPGSYQWSLSQQEKLVICDNIARRESECLPLYALVDTRLSSLDGLDLLYHSGQLSLGATNNDDRSDIAGDDRASSRKPSLASLRLDSDSTADLHPPSPINLRRSIDEALFGEALFPRSLFGTSRLRGSSELSLDAWSPGDCQPFGDHQADRGLYRTSSCVEIEHPPQEGKGSHVSVHGQLGKPSGSGSDSSLDRWGCGSSSSSSSGSGSLLRSSLDGSSLVLCSALEGQGHGGSSSAHPSQEREVAQLQIRYHALGSASQESLGVPCERDLAVQAEFINVCRQIDALSVCSDTIDL